MKTCDLLPHTPLRESYSLRISSHIHDHQEDGKLQACDLSEIAHLGLALDLLHFILLPTLTPTHGSSIVYGPTYK
jgi:hypothetical protein